MGLADFLAEAGRNTAIGQIAQASGGRTVRQRGLDSFVNQELPALAEQIQRASTRDDVGKAGQALISAGLKAGIPPAQLDKLMDMVVGPALQNLQRGELDAIRRDYGPQPAQPRPEGTEGPLTAGGNFIDPRAERPPDTDMAMRVFQATGASPQHFNQIIRAPAQIAEDRAKALASEASTRKTEGEIAKQQAMQREFDALDKTPDKDSGVSLRGLAAFPSLAQAMEARKKPEDPLLAERRGLIGAQTGAAQAQADLARRRGANVGQENAGTETVVESTMRPGDYSMAEQEIAAAAARRKKTDAKGIKEIAAEMNYELEGEPTLEQPSSWNPFGETPKPKLTGNFRLKPKPKTTTRTKIPTGAAPAGPAKSSNNDPLGIRKR